MLTFAAGLFVIIRFATRRGDLVSPGRLAEEQLQLLAIDGEIGHLRRAKEALHQFSSAAPADKRDWRVLYLSLRVELAFHHFAEARKEAEQLCELVPAKALPLQLLGSACFNLGEYAEAGRFWEKAVAMEGETYTSESRRAQLELVYGRLSEAKNRLTAALALANQLAPPASVAIAWCEVQIGELAFSTGDWEEAEKRYQSALSTQPDYLPASERLAELRGAQGRIDESIAFYTRLIAQTNRPDLMQAIGDLFAFRNRKEEADRWYARAETTYNGSIDQDEIVYLHHLAGLYADALGQPEKALQFAQRDFENRKTIQTSDELAWALYKSDRTEEANESVTRALATGTREPHILYHAAMIRTAAGDVSSGREMFRLLLEINPRFQTFHVHR